MAALDKTLGDWLDTFEVEAFRLETLDDYSQSGGVEAYQAFLAGEIQPESFRTAAWVKTVGDAVQAGRRMYRVHVLSRPLTSYLRFELGWGYRRNALAGEEFFILDTTSRETPVPGVPDFWMFDNQVVGAMSYDAHGAFLGVDFDASERVEEFVAWRDTALAHAEPFANWWARHGD
ncbi:DUF6879 family protein [Kitasatospora sp. NBC_01300]|uniref:DUF6879 family protein n=1 Tax=Kitasatospora sp. NBC_01300 TaxID=2903574 RepID=UPI00352D525C|nr:hypothetical protein OG556_17140 [Kitasatospora sp. NBC_01300]